MSFEAINWAYAQDLPPGPKFVLVTLATSAIGTACAILVNCTLPRRPDSKSERSEHINDFSKNTISSRGLPVL